MRLPSVKTLSTIFGDKAKEARTVLEAARPSTLDYPAVHALVKSCYHMPARYACRLAALNAIGGFHGVESIETARGEYAEYLNAGDVYVPTLIYWRGAYRVQCLGDFVEVTERGGCKWK